MYYTVGKSEVINYFILRGRIVAESKTETETEVLTYQDKLEAEFSRFGNAIEIPDYEILDLIEKSQIVINDWIQRKGFANTSDYDKSDYKEIVEEAICRLCYDFKYSCVIDEKLSLNDVEYKQKYNTYLWLRDKNII